MTASEFEAKVDAYLEVMHLSSPVASKARQALLDAHAEVQAERDALLQQAQIHAQEARTANATIAEIYQLCSGGKGEFGNWHGAEPVRKVLEDLAAAKADNERLREAIREQAHGKRSALTSDERLYCCWNDDSEMLTIDECAPENCIWLQVKG